MARIDTLSNYLTDVADAIRVKKGTSDPISAEDFDTEIENLPGGGGVDMRQLNGEFDAQGLATIGWSNDEIQFYNQNGVQWRSGENNLYKLNASELAGDTSSNTRFYPKTSGAFTGTFENYENLIAIPLLDTNNNSDLSFSGCLNLVAIPQIDFSKKMKASYLFQSCSSLRTAPSLDFSGVDQSNAGRNMFNGCRSLESVPQFTGFSNIKCCASMFQACYALKSIPQLDTSNVTNMSSMFSNCYSLKTVPVLDTSKVTNFSSMFSGDTVLSDETLDNILQMCAGASVYEGTKTLYYLGLRSTYYPVSRIEALSNYQAFLDAGWTIGY